MSFFCEKCDTPVHGEAVAEGVCNACLMGNEVTLCVVCGDRISDEDPENTCESCQKYLDTDGILDDDDLLDGDDEEFLRGPNFN